MTWFLHLHQRDEGCDYTIGCGQVFLALQATSKDEAVAEAKEKIQNYSVNKIKGATLLECAAPQNLGDLIDDLKRQAEKVKKEAELERKRAQLAALKKELGEE